MLTSNLVKDVRTNLNMAQDFGQEVIAVFHRCSKLPSHEKYDQTAQELALQAGDLAFRAWSSAGWFVEGCRTLATEFHTPTD